jgi:hypothetical protein
VKHRPREKRPLDGLLPEIAVALARCGRGG